MSKFYLTETVKFNHVFDVEGSDDDDDIEEWLELYADNIEDKDDMYYKLKCHFPDKEIKFIEDTSGMLDEVEVE